MCLMGERVRYDGRHKHDPLITGLLAERFELVPVCPELEMGLGAPREPMSLSGDSANPRLITNETGRDLTKPMLAWCANRLCELEKENLAGFIFKSKSPSCGLSVSGYRGLFARAFTTRFPNVPVVEDVQLHDPALRKIFVERVIARADKGPR